MGKSKKRRHFMEEGSQLDTMRSIRKPMPPPSRVITPKDANKQNHWDWRDELNHLDMDDIDDLDGANDVNDLNDLNDLDGFSDIVDDPDNVNSSDDL